MGAMHADELAIDAALVARLLATQFPRWAELPFERVEPSGTDNAIYRLGRRHGGSAASSTLVWRHPRRGVPVAAEARAIPAAGDPRADRARRARRRLSVPVVDLSVARGRERDARAHRPTRSQAAMDLAGFISALQAVDPTGGPAPEWSGRPVWNPRRLGRAEHAGPTREAQWGARLRDHGSR